MRHVKLYLSIAILGLAGMFATTTASCGGSGGMKALFDLGKADTATEPADIAMSRDLASPKTDLSVDANVAAACTNYCKCENGSTSSGSTSTGCYDDCTSDLSSASFSTSTSMSAQQTIDCLAAASTCAQVNTCLGYSSSTTN